MKQILMLLLICCLTGCTTTYIDNTNKTDDPEVISENTPDTNVDWITTYKLTYETSAVYQNILSPISYLLITETQIIFLTRTPDFDSCTYIRKDQISAIESNSLPGLVTLQFSIVGEDTKYTFAATADQVTEIKQILKKGN